MQKIVSTVRSTRSDYNLPNKAKTALYLKFFDEVVAAELSPYEGVIGTLAYSDPVSTTAQAPTKGCAIVTVSDKCSAHLALEGLIDPVIETERLRKKRDNLENIIGKLKVAMNVDGYEEKVPEEIRTSNKEKLAQLDTERHRLEDAIAALASLIVE